MAEGNRRTAQAPGELAIERWAKGRNKLLVMVAHEIASSAEAVHLSCDMARKQMRVDGGREAPDAAHWMKCYEGGALVAQRSASLVLTHLGMAPEEAEATARVPRYIRRLCSRPAFIKRLADEVMKMDRVERERALREGQEQVEKDWRAFLECVRSGNEFEQIEASPGAGNPLENLDMVFYLGVYFPCWMQYGASPKSLLEKARGGDRDAILKLLRLDKVVLEDAAIRKAYQDAQFSRNPKLRNDFENALQGQPLEPLSMVHVKKVLGGLIWHLGQEWGEIVSQLERRLERDGYGRLHLPG